MQSLIEMAGDDLKALASDLAEIAGKPLVRQHLYYWRRINAVPRKWLPAVREYLRRRGTEPSADDVVTLMGGPAAGMKDICKKPRRQAPNGAKTTRLCAKPQLDGATT
jgi:hypothetical protein